MSRRIFRCQSALTVQYRRAEIDAGIAVPGPPPLLHVSRDDVCFHLVHPCEVPISGPEADDDLGDAQEEALNPPLEQLPLKICGVTVVSHLCRGLKFDPVDWARR